MKVFDHRFLLAAMLYFIATATGLGGVINHSVTLNSSDLTFSEVEEDSATFVIPEIAGIESYGKHGCPILPKITLHFALPVYAKDINLEVNSCSTPTHYSLPYPIASGVDRIISSSPNAESMPHAEGSGNSTPVAEIFHVENYKGLYKIASVVVNPLMEAGDGVDFFENISFSISFNENNTGEGPDNVNPEKYELDMIFLRDMVENPEVISSSISPATSGDIRVITRPLPRTKDAYEYTIVTSEELAPAFQRLVALKRLQGYDAGITTTEYIFGCGKYSKGDTISNICDSAGILKAYFMDNKNVIEYILLGGKPPIVPVRYGYFNKAAILQFEKNIPSDLYYGTDSTNWNIPEIVSECGEYGSYYPGFNYTSLFKIGRLSCTTQKEVNNYIDKLEIYELNPGLGDMSYLQRGYAHVSTELSSDLDQYRRNHLSYNQILSDKMSSYFDETKYSYGKNNLQTGREVIEEMDEDYGFFNIIGHGNPDGISTIDYSTDYPWTNGISAIDKERVWQLDESGNGLNNIHNFGKPNIMLTHSCNTIAFDSPAYKGWGKFATECNSLTYNISESFTLGKNYGGVAYIGHTRPVYKQYGAKMNIQFLDNLNIKGNSATVGELVEASRAKIDNAFEHIDLLGYGLIGDPTVRIWEGTSLPQTANDPYDINRNFSDSTIVVTLDINGDKATPVRKYSRLSAVEPNGRILYAPINDNDTQVIFRHIDPNAVVYLTGNNILPYIGDLEIAESYDFSQHLNYIYSRKVNLGSTTNTGLKTNTKVKFSSVSTTIDATGEVTLGSNVVVGDGKKASYLTIITPDTCYINSIQISNLSKVTVYAGYVVLGDFFGNKESLARIEIKPYDKYDQYSKHTSDIRKQPKSRDNDYRPMLEQGKTWKYSLVDWTTISYPTFQPGRLTEHLRETRLEGYETINGETYMKMIVYYDGSETPAESNPMYYLREDTETGKIHFYPNYEFDDSLSWENSHIQQWIYDDMCIDAPGLLYDFGATDGHNFSTYETQYESSVMLPDGEHRCFDLDWGLRVIEGIGLTSSLDGCSILGVSTSTFPSTPDSYYRSYLYEVVNSDGETIYIDTRYLPGWWEGKVGLKDIMAEARVSVTSGGIAITGAPDAEVGLYDMPGRMLSGGHTANGCLNLSTAGMTPGVYLLRIGSQTFKIAIR